MREIHACTEEVFRRSEKRIKARKKARNRMLLLCIPACLAVTALSAMILPAMRTQGNTADMVFSSEDSGRLDAADRSDGTNGIIETSQESAAHESVLCPYTAVEVQAADLSAANSGKVTDQAVVEGLFDTIRSLFEDVEKESQVRDEAFEVVESAVDRDQTGSAGSEAYTILFTSEEGLKTAYHLSGNTLSNGDTNETVVLSDTQAAELLSVFGISK